MIRLQAATPDTVSRAMAILISGREFQRKEGFTQWSDDYPSRSLLEEDVRLGRGYFLTVAGKFAAYLCIDPAGDASYADIRGAWHTEEPYAVVHRMAFDAAFRGRGLSDRAFRLIAEHCRALGARSLRIDTGVENTRMQHVLEKCGFTYAGLVFFEGEDRRAYEMAL